MQLDTITEQLNIPNQKVTRIVQNTKDRLEFILEPIEETYPVCSGCDRIYNTYAHSRSYVVIEDLPISGKRVFLHVCKRKIFCSEDRSIRVEEFDWIRKRFTKRFADQVYRLTSITTNQEAGWYLGLDDETVYRIDMAILEELALNRLPVTAPVHMSVDEVAWQKWHKYVTNVVDIDKRKVIWNHNSRGKAILDKFYHEIGQDQCDKIEVVASDGARGFMSSTKEHAKNALIVLDHFHVKKYLNDAVDKVRKEELKKARQENNSDLSDILHCNKRFILMQNKVTNKRKNLLEKLSTLNQKVYQASLLIFITIHKKPETFFAPAIIVAYR